MPSARSPGAPTNSAPSISPTTAPKSAPSAGSAELSVRSQAPVLASKAWTSPAPSTPPAGPAASGHRACVGVRRGNDVGQDTRRDVEHVDRTDTPQPDRLIAGCAHVQESVARRHHRPEGALGDRILRLEGAQQDAVAPV